MNVEIRYGDIAAPLIAGLMLGWGVALLLGLHAPAGGLVGAVALFLIAILETRKPKH